MPMHSLYVNCYLHLLFIYLLSQDSSGLPQKLVTFQFGKGVTACMYIRKMAQDDSQCQVLSNKRAFQGEEKSIESKRLRTDQKPVEETMVNFNQFDDHLRD